MLDLILKIYPILWIYQKKKKRQHQDQWVAFYSQHTFIHLNVLAPFSH